MNRLHPRKIVTIAAFCLALVVTIVAGIAPHAFSVDVATSATWHSDSAVRTSQRSTTITQGRQPSTPPSPLTPAAIEFLNAHNKYRKQVGVPLLVWSDKLAASAQQWANSLASRGAFEHSSNSQRPGEGENLWRGTSGRFSRTVMVDGWGSEQRYFQNGIFPNVSSTGNWVDVGHYTQMIWKTTRELGCGVATGRGYDTLVCRYSPPGNFQGQRVY